jgi:hypothetical protein
MTQKTTAPRTKPTTARPLFAGQSTDSSTHAGTEPAPEAAVAEADFVTEMFNLLETMAPALAGERLKLERAVRVRFGGVKRRVTLHPDPDTLESRVLALFNGRNSVAVAGQLGITRRRAYQIIQAARLRARQQKQ